MDHTGSNNYHGTVDRRFKSGAGVEISRSTYEIYLVTGKSTFDQVSHIF